MTTSTKTRVEEAELKGLIQERLGYNASLVVTKNKFGFTATALGVMPQMQTVQAALDEIVNDLNQQFELSEASGKPKVSEQRLKQEIMTLAHQHPEGRYLTIEDIAITRRSSQDWSAGFVHDRDATPACVFHALTLVKNKFDLAV